MPFTLGSEWFAGSGATRSISPARDRLVGVALGILVMWFVFDQIWPVRTSDALRKSCFASARYGLQFDGAASKKSPSVRDGLGNLVFDRS